MRVEVEAMNEGARVPESWGKEKVGAWESIRRREKVRPLTHLTMHVKDGVWVSMREARNEH